MPPFYIITGFLGSGKTTLLKNILQQLGSDKKVAVIQNEFAPSGVDGKLLRQTDADFHLEEMNNGSVFCVCQLSNFVDTLIKICDTVKPEAIFLETSGMADPISVAELLSTPVLEKRMCLGGLITVVDAFNFERGLSVLTRFKHQLMVADKVLLNKTDLPGSELPDIRKKITELNPFAQIEETTYARVNWKTFMGMDAGRASARFAGTASGGRPQNMKALVLRSHRKLDAENLSAFLNELLQSCIRIKGFVNLTDGSVCAVQCVFNQVEQQVVQSYMGSTELIVFTNTLQIGDLRQCFKKYTT